MENCVKWRDVTLISTCVDVKMIYRWNEINIWAEKKIDVKCVLHKEDHTVVFYDGMPSEYLVDRVINGNYQIACEILEDLKSWLVNHIQITDQKYIDCFAKNGLK